MTRQFTCLAGGVGAARFLQGLVELIPAESLTVIVNTGDDIELHGLHISPDLDIVMYTLGGIVDEEKGWGIKGDSFHCIQMLQKYGHETWFNLGDMDIATHIQRTMLLKSGLKLSQVTSQLCHSLGLKVRVLPMTDDRFETRIITDAGDINFQEYLVKRCAKDTIVNVAFAGVEKAQPAPDVIDAILNADGIIVCPSNPIVSIGTILSVKGIRKALKDAPAKVAAISPIVGGAPIKGPADKMMRSLRLEVSSYAVADLYRDFLDILIIDLKDEGEKSRIENLGLQTIVTNTIMKNLKDKVQLAGVVLDNFEER